MSSGELHQVRIEFLRVQTFLFAVPRLRDMVGANVLLGEMLRVKLPKLAEEHTCKTLQVPEFLDKADACDPLEHVSDDFNKDNPRALYEKGILARDGGHFIALFPNKEKADAFAEDAQSEIVQNLPGLRFEISCSPFLGGPDKTGKRASAHSVVDLPQFQVCQESGNGPANRSRPDPDNRSRRIWVSARASDSRRAGARFFRGMQLGKPRTEDIIGLLGTQLPPIRSGKHKLKEPVDLQSLCGKDYLAVIHADGNEMGKRSNTARNSGTAEDKLIKEANGENFYHRMRVAVRRSVVDALKKAFEEYTGKVRPYQLLMLGGDDLLMVCQAKYAFPFLIEYAKNLQNHKLPDDNTPLTIGAGVVIASPNVPFHHLHHLAEELASSAKQLYRGGQKVSVVDWLVSTNSWVDDPISTRVRDSLVSYSHRNARETLILTGRPYPVLQQEAGQLDSLEGLWQAAEKVQAAIEKQGQEKAARSQLRWLVEQLGKGKRQAELAYRDMPKTTRDALNTQVWRDILTKESETYYQTPLADWVELYEVFNLAKQEKSHA